MAANSFAARIKQKAKEAEFSGGSETLKLKDGVSFFKPKKGRNLIMFLPFEIGKNLEGLDPGEIWYRMTIRKHYGIGPEDKTVICPSTIGKKCPICEHKAALLSQGRGTDDDEVKALMWKRRELYWVIDLNDKEGNEDPQVLETSYFTFGKKLEEEIREADDDSPAARFATVEDGAVVEVRMNEESLGKNKYLEAGRFDFYERKKGEQRLVDEGMKKITPFDEMLNILSYQELKKLFYDLSDDEVTDGEEPRSSARSSRDEEEEKPRSRQGSRRDDDYEEDTTRRRPISRRDEDEDEDEEKPRRPVRGSEDCLDDEHDHEPRRSSRSRRDEEEEEENGPTTPDPFSGKSGRSAKDDGEKSPSSGGKKQPSKVPGRGKQDDGPKCPVKANAYGKKCDLLDECPDCDIWADCRDLTDKYEESMKG